MVLQRRWSVKRSRRMRALSGRGITMWVGVPGVSVLALLEPTIAARKENRPMLLLNSGTAGAVLVALLTSNGCAESPILRKCRQVSAEKTSTYAYITSSCIQLRTSALQKPAHHCRWTSTVFHAASGIELWLSSEKFSERVPSMYFDCIDVAKPTAKRQESI